MVDCSPWGADNWEQTMRGFEAKKGLLITTKVSFQPAGPAATEQSLCGGICLLQTFLVPLSVSARFWCRVF